MRGANNEPMHQDCRGLDGLRLPAFRTMRAGRWQRGDDVIFFHTGGEPAIFAYQGRLSI
jgi:hypothetical protein